MSVNKINYKGVDYEIIEDTGWINAEMTEYFKTYNDQAYRALKYRKYGNIVEIHGCISTTFNETIEGDVQYTIFNLPEGFRPTLFHACICHTYKGNAPCLIRVEPGGKVEFRGYTPYAAANEINSGIMINVSIIYTVD